MQKGERRGVGRKLADKEIRKIFWKEIIKVSSKRKEEGVKGEDGELVQGEKGRRYFSELLNEKNAG